MAKQVCANKPRCPNLVERGYCEACSAKGCGRDLRPSAAARGYDGRWAKASKAFLVGKLCADPYGRHGQRRVAAEVTDHRVPWRGDWTLFWDRANWQPLCFGCHGIKTATEDGGFGHARAAR